MQNFRLKRGQEFPAPDGEMLVFICSGVVRMDHLDVRRQRRLFLHLAMPGDHLLLGCCRVQGDEFSARALTAVVAQCISRQHAQFDCAMQSLARVMRRRHTESIQLKAASTITQKISTLFHLLSTQAGLTEDSLLTGGAMQQVQIASILGVSPESVSRALRELREVRHSIPKSALRMQA